MNHEPPPRAALAWDIPEAARRIIPDMLVEMIVARDDGTERPKPLHDPRIRIAATQALVSMHRQNQTEKPEPIDELLDTHQQRSRLAALARQFDVGELAPDALPDATESGADEFGPADGLAPDAA